MKLMKTKLVAAAAITALGLGAAMPASAALVLRVTDQGSGVSFVCADAVGVASACDTNVAVNAIGLDALFANTTLGAGRAFNVEGASATAANTGTLAQIDQSGNVTATTVPGFLSIFFDASFDGFNLGGQNPRTMSTSGTATFTNSLNLADNATLRAFNDPDNMLFAGIAGDPATSGNEFAAPLITLDPGVSTCAGGNPVSCLGASMLGGIVEGDPFSLTNRYAVQTGESTPGNNVSVQFTASTLKFGTTLVVPEPTSLLLVGAGILGLGLVGRRKKS